jgi:hypothetical protein
MKLNRTLSIALTLLLSMGIVCMAQAQNGVELSDEQALFQEPAGGTACFRRLAG